MDDLISRQAAIDCMVLLQREDEETYGASIPEGFDGDRAAEVLNRLPSAQQWIPCSERLPKDDETVIVTRDDGTVKIATFEVGEIENGWQIGSWYTEDNVVAWMPLPEPYEDKYED